MARIIHRRPKHHLNLLSASGKMEQSSVTDTKRKPDMLSQQPLKPKQPPKNREGELPRTPYPIPRDGRKRSVSSSEDDDCMWEGKSKKRKIVRDGKTLRRPPYLASFPSFDSKYPPANQYRIISPVELMKVWESILDQVDWSEVVQESGGRESPTYIEISSKRLCIPTLRN